MQKKQLTVTAFDDDENEVDLDFNVDLADVNSYLNGSHKIPTQAMFNFLSRNIDDGSRENFERCLLDKDRVMNGVKVGEIAALIIEEFAGKSRASIKKRNK